MKKVFLLLIWLLLTGASLAQTATPPTYVPVTTLPTGACTPAIDTAIRIRMNAGTANYKYCDRNTNQWTDGIPNYDANALCTTNQMLYYAATGQTQSCATLGSRLSFTGATLNVTPAGSTTHVQINDGGVLSGSGAFTFDPSTATVGVGTASSLTGKINLKSASSAFSTTIQPGAPAANLTFTWPATLPASAGCLEVSSSGVITQTGSACGSGGGGGISGAVTGNLIKAASSTTGTDAAIVATQAANSVTSRYNVLDYASLSAAVTAIGSTNNATLVIPTSLSITANVTITENITTEFTNSGRFAIATGVIVNHRGIIKASPRKIFALTGTGRIIFSGIDCTTSCTQNTSTQFDAISGGQTLEYYPQWWGVVGDWDTVSGTDDTTALQQMLNVIPSNARVLFTPNLRMKVSSTLTFYNRKAVRFEAIGPLAKGKNLGDKGVTFFWAGADGGTLLDLGGLRDCVFDGLGFVSKAVGGAASTVGADRLVWLEQINNGSGGISSNNTFKNCLFYQNSLRSGFIAVYIGDATGQNNEYHKFYGCKFTVSNSDVPGSGLIVGTGIYIAHSNVKQIILQDTDISSAARGIDCEGGSFIARDSAISRSMLAYYAQSWTDKILIEGDDSEEIAQLLVVPVGGGGVAPITIRKGRYDRSNSATIVPSSIFATTANPFIDSRGATLIVEGNFFGQWYHSTSTAANNYYANSRYLTVGTSGGSLIWKNNTFVDFNTDFLFSSFKTYGYVDASDRSWGTLTSTNANGNFPFYRNLDQTGNIVDIAGVEPATLDPARPILSACGVNNLCFQRGVMEFTGIPAVGGVPFVRAFGTTGATTYRLSVVAKDASGRRTMRTQVNQFDTANATLTGSNYLEITWEGVVNATSYDIVQTNNAVSTEFRVIATVTAPTTLYQITSNPAGAYTYVPPVFNETAGITARGGITQSAVGSGMTNSLIAPTSIAATARTSGTHTYHTRIVTPADTGLAASTESVGFQIGGNTSAAAVTRTFAAGAITTQRENLFVAPIYAFASGSTLTNAATVSITGAPTAGASATITNPLALWIQAGESSFAGNLGIGVTNPTLRLDIADSSSGALVKLQNSDATGYTAFDVYDSSGTARGGIGYSNASSGAPFQGQMYVSATNGKDLFLVTNNLNRFSVQNGGNLVGVSGVAFGWSSSSTDPSGVADTAAVRAAAGTIRTTNGSTGTGNLLIGPSTASVTGSFTVVPDNAATNALVTVGRFSVNSTGTAAAGLGPLIDLAAETTTTNDQQLGSIAGLWTTATHASRTGAITFSTVNNAGSNTERFRIDHQGIQPAGVVFASLGTPGNNYIQICTDCTVTSGADNTCAGSGTGALAVRLNGVWRCFNAQN